jgi:hypothetical protein
MFGLIHFSRQPFHSSNVAGAIGLRLRELYLGIVPVLVGEGIPMFAPGFPQREFTLTENKTYSGGLIALKYERVRGKAAVEGKRTSKSNRKR